MAPNPLSCPNRLVFPYIVNGLTHVHHVFCEADDIGGGDYTLLANGATAQDWKDDAQDYLDRWQQFMSADASFGDIRLEQLEAGVYVPLASDPPASAIGQSGDAYFPASQLTVVLYDEVFRKIRLNIMESVQGNPFHYLNTSTPNTWVNAFLTDITAPVVDTDAGFWLKSRTNYFVRGYISVTATDNRSTRRDRSII